MGEGRGGGLGRMYMGRRMDARAGGFIFIRRGHAHGGTYQLVEVVEAPERPAHARRPCRSVDRRYVGYVWRQRVNGTGAYTQVGRRWGSLGRDHVDESIDRSVGRSMDGVDQTGPTPARSST